MTWFKVDDGFYDHPKFLEVPNAAVGLWVKAGAWCGRHLTDGLIPAAQIKLFKGTPAQVKALTSARIWVETQTENGSKAYRFNDWNEYQPTREQKLKERADAAERQRKKRERKRPEQQEPENVTRDSHVTGARDSHESHTNLSQHPDPTRPDPTRITTDVVIEESTQADAEPEKPKRATAHLLPENWQPTDKVKQDLAAQFPTYDLERILRRFHDYWHSQPVGKARKRDWNRTFRNWVDSETRPPLISERTQPTAPGRLSNAEVARQLQERNAQDQAQQRELSNAEALEAWMQEQKAIGF